MHRLFGKAKPKEPAPTLDDASKSIEKRGGSLDERIKSLDAELLKYKQQLSKMKPGPAKRGIEQRALRILQQKKVYEKQRDAVFSQQFNIDQAKFATESIKDTKTMVDAMKVAKTELKAGYKDIKLDEIEDLHDDMNDLLEDADEVNEILGRAYGVPETLDETDLLDELNSLELEGELETESSIETESTPSYLVNAASAEKTQKIKENNSIAAAGGSKNEIKESGGIEVDEFGLPKVPANRIKV